MAGFDIANTDYLLSFSSGLLEGWGSPVYMFRAKSAMHEHGGRMHQIESRLSKTAAKSEKWIPIRPGTEGALALGLAHVIIKEGLYKREFVEGYCNGFAEQKKLVIDAYTPEIVSKMTGVDARSIVSLARDFAKAKRPLAICGRGEGQTPGSLQEFLAVHSLNALVGNINRPGGLWSVPEPDYIDWPEAEMDGVAAKAMQETRFDEAGTQDFPRARYLLTRLPDIINASAQSPIEALFISNANPVYSLPDSESVQKAFDQIPLVVSFSSFMDESAVHADYVLPNHVYLERIEDVPLALGFPKPLIGLVQPAVYPQLETRHTGDVIIQLAQQLGGTIADAFPWEEYETCLEETLADNWDSLTENGYWIDEQFEAAEWDAAFETETNRFEFSNDTLSSLPQYNPVEPAGDETQYPLVLVPYDSMRLSAGYVGSPPFLMKSLEDTILQKNDVLVEVNPKTARKYGLREGGDALLSTPKASGRVKVRLFEGIMPDVIALPRGLGHTAYDEFLAQKGINYNRLVGPIEDVASGHDAAWGIRAKLVRA
jgi:anaerobic selenocysteine-containing dehydrogenase